MGDGVLFVLIVVENGQVKRCGQLGVVVEETELDFSVDVFRVNRKADQLVFFGNGEGLAGNDFAFGISSVEHLFVFIEYNGCR